MNRAELAAHIDHTLLKPDATAEQIRQACAEARAAGCAAMCVNGSRVALARAALAGSGVAVAGVVGFPLGAMATEIKAAEAARAVADGAAEIDMVMQLGAFRDGDREQVKRDVAAVVRASGRALVKVILETGLLADEEKVQAALLAVEAGARFVKTSTGFGGGGATVADVALLRQAVGERARIKASGGIKDARSALALIEAGADRLGMSATTAVLASLA